MLLLYFIRVDPIEAILVILERGKEETDDDDDRIKVQVYANYYVKKNKAVLHLEQVVFHSIKKKSFRYQSLSFTFTSLKAHTFFMRKIR